jgi:peptidoglycan/xylan/chitin deacetylase (PgdA/CDA1 family)
MSRERRVVPRLVAFVALAAGIAAVVVVAVSLGGGDDGSGTGPGSGTPPHPQRPSRIDLPAIAPVRNANPQPDWRSHPGAVPILRYHVVGSPPPGTSELELFVTPGDFRAQLEWLAEHGYEAVGLETVERAWFAGGTLPAKPIVLSFDGVRGRLLDVVAPELRRRGWPADLVLDTEARPLRLAAVARLLALGWDVEPSGREPAAARRFVRSRLPAPARNFAFRHGNGAKPEVPALEAAGYSGATAPGGGFARASHRFDLPRITIFNESEVDGFAEAIRSHGEGVGA